MSFNYFAFYLHNYTQISHGFPDWLLLHVVGVLGAGLHELDAKGVRQLLRHRPCCVFFRYPAW